jgi:hypothetical protein
MFNAERLVRRFGWKKILQKSLATMLESKAPNGDTITSTLMGIKKITKENEQTLK